jgi:hypothetical protein
MLAVPRRKLITEVLRFAQDDNEPKLFLHIIEQRSELAGA